MPSVCLPIPTDDFDLSDKTVTIVGQGYISNNGTFPTKLQKLEIKVRIIYQVCFAAHVV